MTPDSCCICFVGNDVMATVFLIHDSGQVVCDVWTPLLLAYLNHQGLEPMTSHMKNIWLDQLNKDLLENWVEADVVLLKPV